MTQTRPHRGQAFTDAAEDLWFPAHQSAGDSFLRVRSPDGGADEPEDDGIGLPGRGSGGGGPRKPRKRNVSVSPWIWGTLLGVAALGVIVTLARKEIAAEMVQGWLKGQGIPAKIKFDKLSLGDASGTAALGKGATVAGAPVDLDSGHFTADFSLNLFAAHGQPLVRLNNLHVVHPVLYASLKDGKLKFGTMDKLVQDSLNAPPSSGPAPKSILIEDAVVHLDTDYGLVVAKGGVTMQDGRLTFAALKLPAARLQGKLGEGTLSEGQLTAKSAGSDQLEIHGQFGAADWTVLSSSPADTGETNTRLDGVTLGVDARVPYKNGAFAGPVQGAVTLKADKGQTPAATFTGLDLAAQLNGQLRTDKAKTRYDGKAHLAISARTLKTGDTDARAIRLEGPALDVSTTLGDKGLALGLSGTLNGDAGALTSGDLSVKGARLGLKTLTAAIDSSGSRATFTGNIALAQGSAAGLTLDNAVFALDGEEQGDPSGAWAANIKSDIRSDGSYDGLKPLADSHRSDPKANINTDGLVALDRGLRHFSLHAKGLRVALTAAANAAPRVDLRLNSPAEMTLDGGGTITLTPQPGRPLLAAGNTGGFSVAMRGATIPEADLTVSGFGQAPSGLIAGDYHLVSHFSTFPVSNLGFDAHGQFALNGGDFNLTLAAPTHVTAASADLGDHFESVSVDIAQTGGAFFRMTPAGWRITGSYSSLSMTAPAESIAFSGAQGPLDVFSQAGSDQPGMKIAMSGGTVTDALPTPRFRPVKMSGTLNQDTRALTGRFKAATPNAQGPDGKPLPIADINLDNDLRTNTGSLSTAANLTFVPGGLQPTDLTDTVSTVMRSQVTGTTNFTGAFDWKGDQTTSHGVLKVAIDSFVGGMGAGRGLKGEIDFTSLAPLQTQPSQTISLDHLQAVVPLDNFVLKTQFLGDHIAVERADVMTPGGLVRLDPTSIPLDGTSPINGALAFDGLDFGQIVAASSLKDTMTFEGKLTGRVPFTIIVGQVPTFQNGSVRADAPGRISIKRTSVTDISASGSLATPDSKAAAGSAAQPAFNPFQDMAFQAMEHISYDQLDAKVNSLPDGRIDINFHVKGRFDPPQPQKATITLPDYLSGKWMQKPMKLPSNTPIELFLDVPVKIFDQDAATLNALTPALSGK
jgi:hypothetical protein